MIMGFMVLAALASMVTGIVMGVKRVKRKQYKKAVKAILIGLALFIVLPIVGAATLPPTAEAAQAQKEQAAQAEKEQAAKDAEQAKQDAAQAMKDAAMKAQKVKEKAKRDAEKKTEKLRQEAGVATAMIIEREYYAGIASVEFTNDTIYITYNNKNLIPSLLEQQQLGNSVAGEMLYNAQQVAKKASKESGGLYNVFLTVDGYNAWTGSTTGWEYHNGKQVN